MKVTVKTKFLALTLSAVALVSAPQQSHANAFSSITETLSNVSTNTGLSSGLKEINDLIGDYKNFMDEYSAAACEVSSGLGNSSLYGAVTKKIQGVISSNKGSMGGFVGGIADNVYNDLSDATKSRHTCIIEGRQKLMEEAMKVYYTSQGDQAGDGNYAQDYITDFLTDAAGDYLNENVGGIIGDNIDFNNVTDQFADCVAGEASDECGG